MFLVCVVWSRVEAGTSYTAWNISGQSLLQAAMSSRAGPLGHSGRSEIGTAQKVSISKLLDSPHHVPRLQLRFSSSRKPQSRATHATVPAVRQVHGMSGCGRGKIGTVTYYPTDRFFNADEDHPTFTLGNSPTGMTCCDGTTTSGDACPKGDGGGSDLHYGTFIPFELPTFDTEKVKEYERDLQGVAWDVTCQTDRHCVWDGKKNRVEKHCTLWYYKLHNKGNDEIHELTGVPCPTFFPPDGGSIPPDGGPVMNTPTPVLAPRPPGASPAPAPFPAPRPASLPSSCIHTNNTGAFCIGHCLKVRGNAICEGGHCVCTDPGECAVQSDIIWPIRKPVVCLNRDGSGEGSGNKQNMETLVDAYASSFALPVSSLVYLFGSR